MAQITGRCSLRIVAKAPLAIQDITASKKTNAAITAYLRTRVCCGDQRACLANGARLLEQLARHPEPALRCSQAIAVGQFGQCQIGSAQS